MKTTHRLLFLAVLFALVIPLVMTGTASAKYIGDAAVPNGTTGGWDLPADRGVCITGIKSDGTIIFDNTITSRPDCLARTFPYATSGDCKTSDSGGANVEGSHYWTNTCVDGSGNGISLKDLDRTTNMCAQNGGTWGSKCTSTWTNLGPSLNGTDGFCYTRLTLTDVYTDLTCPTTTFGYSVVDYGICSDPTKTTEATCLAVPAVWTPNKKCTYAYGTVGVAAAKLTNMAGGTYAAAGANVNLAGLLMGQCLYNGASFSNHTTKGGDATVGVSTVASPITGVRAGCLACHNNTSQYNSYAGRWKSDYLKTGHKNMLRKVTAANVWAGPDANGAMEIYTTAASGQTLDFVTAQATGSYGTKPLMYLFGDWMAPAPDGLDTVVWDVTTAKYNGGSGYSCAACHTTGWRNEDTTKGVCSQSSKTTEAACTTAGGTWYPTTGAEGYGHGGVEPAASFPAYATGNTIPGITGQWDVDGIVCTRCHMVTFDNTLPLNENGVMAAPGHTTHETEIFEGEIITNICYGCHQSPAKITNGTGLDNDLAHPEAIPVKNTVTAPAYTPELSGHVLGGSFLNSPHGLYTGSIKPNNLGKYDIDGGTYASTFKGKVCRSSATAGSGSVLETTATGGIIKTLEDCNRANGKPLGDTTSYGYWQDEAGSGNCTTCHNVHESLFVADANEPLRRECATCHVDDPASYPTAAPATSINHPGGLPGDGTPLADIATKPSSSCEICHMPKATSGGFPMHLWRINTNSAYTTFPTATEFGADGSTATLKNARTAPDGSYTNAVWVDVTNSCGQCHIMGTAPSYTATQLAGLASGMHSASPTHTSAECLSCHSSARGTKRAVNPGVDHHNGTCTACHAPLNGHFGPAMPAWSGATTLKPAGSHNPLPYWGIDTSLRTACLSCHSSTQTRSADSSTIGIIIPSSTGDNHHGGHTSVPGTSFGGVSEANGSRGDNDPGMGCVGCHGKGVILSGDNTAGYVVGLSASGLTTSTVAAQNGRVDTSGLCLGCHGAPEVVQSGPDKNHHSGACVSCHKTDGSTTNGTYAAGVGTLTGGVNCTVQCHTAASATHHYVGSWVTLSCEECHAHAGVTPAAVSGLTMTATDRTSVTNYCQACHVTAQGTTHAIVPTTTEILGDGIGNEDGTCDTGEACTTTENHHRGSSTNATRSVAGCLYCHGNNGGLPFGNAAAEVMLDQTPGTTSCSGACHASSQPASGTHHTGAGLTPVNGFLCLACHTVGSNGRGMGAPGVTDATVWPPATWENCTACHTTEQGTVPAITITKHRTGAGMPGSCAQCHDVAALVGPPATTGSYIGVKPDTQSTCGQCHSNVSIIANAAATMHGSGVVTPDLTVSTLTVPITGGAGKSLNVTYTVTNAGTGASGASHTNFYISTNGMPSGSALASRAAGSLPASGTFTETISLSIPSSPTNGTFYIIAVADALNEVPVELSEANNKAFKTVRLGPDYTLSRFVAPNTGVRGSTVSVKVTTANSGGGDAAAASTTKFYLSTNGTAANSIPGGSLGSIAVAALTGGSSYTPAASVVLSIPGTVAPGRYYIVAVADDGNAVAETYETNNVIFKQITVQ